ncbi:MAG: hypothetical protein JKY49_12995, partial [Cohaesibacteraceae bacterium]|nr:hypothetical protein [Cohaesibacteraceae bacterium]MBL4876429.1 hypothetical protein [Cohaesibacteraceae bacterium]
NEIIRRVAALKEISNTYSVPLPAAALQFPLGHKQISSVIPGLRSEKEVNDTLIWAHTRIPPEYWAALKARNLLHPDAPVPVGNPFIGEA